MVVEWRKTILTACYFAGVGNNFNLINTLLNSIKSVIKKGVIINIFNIYLY